MVFLGGGGGEWYYFSTVLLEFDSRVKIYIGKLCRFSLLECHDLQRNCFLQSIVNKVC